MLGSLGPRDEEKEVFEMLEAPKTEKKEKRRVWGLGFRVYLGGVSGINLNPKP